MKQHAIYDGYLIVYNRCLRSIFCTHDEGNVQYHVVLVHRMALHKGQRKLAPRCKRIHAPMGVAGHSVACFNRVFLVQGVASRAASLVQQ